MLRAVGANQLTPRYLNHMANTAAGRLTVVSRQRGDPW